MDDNPDLESKGPTRISADRVAELSESLSERYDQVCAERSYPAPEVITGLLHEYLSDHTEPLGILDLGCGTGLLGTILRARAKWLVGVDVSAKMLKLAESTGQYDRLVQSDVLEHLNGNHDTYDLIVASGTFHSFGDLSELLRSSLRALKPNGYLMFTLAYGPLMGDSYYYQPEEYFTHAPQYVMQQMGELGVTGGTMRRVKWPSPDPHSEYAMVIAVARPETIELDLPANEA